MILFNLTKYMHKHRDLSPKLADYLLDFKNDYGNDELELYCKFVKDYYISYKRDVMLMFENEYKRESLFLRMDYIYADDENCGIRIWDGVDYAKCYHCGDIVSDVDSTVIDGEVYCDYCRDDNFTYCEHCCEYHHNDDMAEVHTGYRTTEWWCEDCVEDDASYCSRCGELWSDEYITCIDGDNYCDDCRNDYFTQCDECGEWIPNDCIYWDDDRAYCTDCWNNRHSSQGGRRRSYHDNPERVYHYSDEEKENGNASHKMFIGTEVETEKGDYDERLSITNEHGDDERLIYQMRDGSLDDDGIECITQPMSKDFFDKFDFESWMHDLVNAGARSHDAEHCGLHVHLSRTWLKTNSEEEQLLLVGRMRQFLADNSEYVKRFARRSEERWCAYSKAFSCKEDKDGLSKKEIDDKLKDSVKHNCDRYQAINNSNTNTIEFRIFKGTLNPNTYRASVEFCLRVIDYVITHSDETLSWDEFISYKELPQSMKIYMEQRHFEF